MRFEGVARARRRVGLTPLIDVVFLMLIFFMLASALSEERVLALDMATPGAASDATAADVLRIELDADGTTRIDGDPVAAGETRAALLRAGRSEERPIQLVPQGAVSVERVTSALDALETAGARRVTLVREP